MICKRQKVFVEFLKRSLNSSQNNISSKSKIVKELIKVEKFRLVFKSKLYSKRTTLN